MTKQVSVKQFRSHTGFTRTDAIFTLGVALLFGVLIWGGLWLAGEKRRIFVCALHMKDLGQAFADFTADHGDALPPAAVIDGTNSTSWDREIAPYLDPKSAGSDFSSAREANIAYLFKCPSDRELHGYSQPRSYSMPMYDINRAGWPPAANSLGGLGLYLDAKTIKKAREADSAASADTLPAIKTSIVPAPADTALLVERISILNALWATKYACIKSVSEQFDAKTFTAKEFHGGKMNYLMLDGHVELLWPAQSGGQTGTGDQGLWTIRPGD